MGSTHPRRPSSSPSSLESSAHIPLAQTNLSITSLDTDKKDCRYIMAPALKAGLAASGIVGTFPRTLTHCSGQALGLGIWDLYLAQGWTHICQALKHGPDTPSMTGKLLRCRVESLKLEVGMPGQLFLQNYDILGPIASPCWVRTLWKFLFEHNMHIKEDTPSLQGSRQNDKFLIEEFVHLGYRSGDLQTLNRCRLYLQVTTTADISTGCGRFISPLAIEGKYTPDIPRTQHWPQQGRPNSPSWTLWRHALKTLCHHSKLHEWPTPLGDWLTSTPRMAWLHSQATDRLYREIAPTQWVYHQSMSSRSGRSTGRRFHIQAHTIASEHLPNDLARGMATTTPKGIIFSGSAPSASLPTLQPADIDQFMNSDTTSKWLWQGITIFHLDKIASLLQHHQLYAASDGSYNTDKGTTAWLLSDSQGQILISGHITTPGRPSDQGSLRSELFGIYATATTVVKLSQYFKIPEGTVHFGCDSLKALHFCFRKTILNPTEAHYDVVMATQRVIAMHPINWQYTHVKAHQTNTRPLTLWTYLNDVADTTATKSPQQNLPHITPDTTILGEPWLLYTTTYKFTSIPRHIVLPALTNQQGYSYWTKRKILSQDAPPLQPLARPSKPCHGKEESGWSNSPQASAQWENKCLDTVTGTTTAAHAAANRKTSNTFNNVRLHTCKQDGTRLFWTSATGWTPLKRNHKYATRSWHICKTGSNPLPSTKTQSRTPQ